MRRIAVASQANQDGRSMVQRAALPRPPLA
jgi:hypothetical protein